MGSSLLEDPERVACLRPLGKTSSTDQPP